MSYGRQYATTVTVTSSGSQCVAFTVSGTTEVLALKARSIHVYNTGSSSIVYVNVTTTSGASTGDWPLRAGKDFTWTAQEGFYTGVSLLAAASTSSSVVVDVGAYR